MITNSGARIAAAGDAVDLVGGRRNLGANPTTPQDFYNQHLARAWCCSTRDSRRSGLCRPRLTFGLPCAFLNLIASGLSLGEHRPPSSRRCARALALVVGAGILSAPQGRCCRDLLLPDLSPDLIALFLLGLELRRRHRRPGAASASVEARETDAHIQPKPAASLGAENRTKDGVQSDCE